MSNDAEKKPGRIGSLVGWATGYTAFRRAVKRDFTDNKVFKANKDLFKSALDSIDGTDLKEILPTDASNQYRIQDLNPDYRLHYLKNAGRAWWFMLAMLSFAVISAGTVFVSQMPILNVVFSEFCILLSIIMLSARVVGGAKDIRLLAGSRVGWRDSLSVSKAMPRDVPEFRRVPRESKLRAFSLLACLGGLSQWMLSWGSTSDGLGIGLLLGCTTLSFVLGNSKAVQSLLGSAASVAALIFVIALAGAISYAYRSANAPLSGIALIAAVEAIYIYLLTIDDEDDVTDKRVAS